MKNLCSRFKNWLFFKPNHSMKNLIAWQQNSGLKILSVIFLFMIYQIVGAIGYTLTTTPFWMELLFLIPATVLLYYLSIKYLKKFNDYPFDHLTKTIKIGKRLDHYWQNALRMILLMFSYYLIVGLILSGLSYLFKYHQPNSELAQVVSHLQSQPMSMTIFMFWFIVIIAPFVEETIFRGLIVHGLIGTSNRSRWIALSVSSGLFAFAHMSSGLYVYTFVTYLLFAVFVQFMNIKYGMKWGIWTHRILNFIAFLTLIV